MPDPSAAGSTGVAQPGDGPAGFRGGCRCAAIRFRSTAPHQHFIACHCRDCQYSTGGGPAYVLSVPHDAIVLERGTESLREFSVTSDSGNEVVRSFCAICGTPLFERLALRPAIRLIRVGTLDAALQGGPDLTVWTDSAQAWCPIGSDTLQFPKNPPPLASASHEVNPKMHTE